MNGASDWTPDAVQRKLRSLRTAGEPAPDWPLRAAAAVVYSFDPKTLEPVGALSGGRDEAMAELLQDCKSVAKPEAAPEYALRTEARREAIARLGNRDGIRAALAANPPRLDDAFQCVLSGYVQDAAVQLDRQSPDELRITPYVLSMIERLIDGLPSRREVQRLLDRRTLIDWFEHLAMHFSGRKPELDRLRAYVDVPPVTPQAQLRRAMRMLLPERRRLPLMIWGPGGMGKTSLAARLILDSLSGPEAGIPFAYLSLDRAMAPVDEPSMMLAEIAGQLGSEFAPVRDAAMDVLISGFAQALESIGLRDRPFAVVLDEVEELQYRGDRHVEMLGSLLAGCLASIPAFCAVLIGRGRVTQFPTEDLQLSELDSEAAHAFLQRRGIDDGAVRDAVFASVGGNPLSLSLAADVFRIEGGEALRELRRPFFQRQTEGAVAAVLYSRILAHIHREDVRKLAPSALVLRRITPELIQEVLAPVSSLQVPDLSVAHDLLHALAQEVNLVAPFANYSVRFRSDLRRAVLPLVQQSAPEMVQQIHRAAVEYYAACEGPEARTEEMYHLLSLDAEPSVLASRWQPEAAACLVASLEELPLRARGWLEALLRR